MQKYIFFWKPSEKPYGAFCQWARAPFYDEDGNYYENAEKYMMLQKAIYFKDKLTERLMWNTSDPNKLKSLGRSVANYDEACWSQERFQVVVDGNFFKFTQNSNLRALLLSTEQQTIVETSPYDRIWGIGFHQNQALGNEKEWGENLLGKALMKVRDILIIE